MRGLYHRNREEREPCHLHFSAGTMGRVEEGNRAVPLPGPEDTLCWISNSNRSALPLSRPRPHLPFSCSFYVLCEKSRSVAPSCNGTISQNWRKQSIKPSSICWGQSRRISAASTSPGSHAPIGVITEPTGDKTCMRLVRSSFRAAEKRAWGALFTTTLSSVGGYFLFMFMFLS